MVERDIFQTPRGGAISAELQVMAALSYMASNSFQLYVAKILGMTQQTISNCVKRVTTALARRSSQFIYFPTQNEVNCVNIYILKFHIEIIGSATNSSKFL